MSTATPPGALVVEIAAGRVPWDWLNPFPRPELEDSAAGDAAMERAEAELENALDPDRVESDRELPRAFFEAAHRAGLLRLQVDPADGGLGLSDHNTFRVISSLMMRSVAAGFALGVHNGIGLPALLAAAPQPRLRKLIVDRLAQGAVSAWADTEPQGAANAVPTTIAEPDAHGGFHLTGEKVFVGNGTVADELIVSATVTGPDRPRSADTADVRVFLLDTSTPGFRVQSGQEVIGLKGAPLGALRLDRVAVPAERVITGAGAHWRDVGLLEPVSSRGRTYLVSGAAWAIAHRCVQAQKDFVRRRAVDGRPLGHLSAIRRLLARSAADLYALDTVVRWGLIGEAALDRRHRDRYVAKNITTRACWRIAERTMSLLAAEGAETADSKRRRGAPPLPVEQLLRDARVLRVTGGVDFLLDMRASRALVSSAAGLRAAAVPATAPSDKRLTPTNLGHLRAVVESSSRLAQTLDTHVAESDHPVAWAATGRIAGELLSMTLVLARSAGASEREQNLAAIHCSDARRRLAGFWRDIEAEPAAFGEEWLDDEPRPWLP